MEGDCQDLQCLYPKIKDRWAIILGALEVQVHGFVRVVSGVQLGVDLRVGGQIILVQAGTSKKLLLYLYM